MRSTGYKDKLISKSEFYNLLTDILYFYPDVSIKMPLGDIPLRKKDITKLRNKKGFKNVAKTLLYHYQIKEPQYNSKQS